MGTVMPAVGPPLFLDQEAAIETRNAIISTSISTFRFRVYLFARQCELLESLDKPVTICERAFYFVNSLSNGRQVPMVAKTRMPSTHTTSQDVLSPYFLEKWIFSACIQIIDLCEKLTAINVLPEGAAEKYDLWKSQLFYYARKQVMLSRSIYEVY